MSSFLFGEFDSLGFTAEDVEALNTTLSEDGILLHLNEQIDFCKDIISMFEEQKCTKQNRFCITSVRQKYNSSDILFPFDKYTNDELFPKTDERTEYNKLCLENLMILKRSIILMKNTLKITSLRVFVVEGYDTDFQVVKDFTIQQMIDHIYEQVKKSFILDSVIYEIGNSSESYSVGSSN